MNNEELKKKIVKVLKEAFTERDVIPVHTAPDGEKTALPDELCEIFNNIVVQAVIPYFADALIAAGLTFDKTTAILAERTNGKTMILKSQYYDEMKHRAEIAEKALKLACYDKARTYFPNVPNEEYENRRDKYYREYVEKSEKELAEEGKDD